jgi:hypothetical protein
MTVDECKQACEEATDYHCLSFDYYVPSTRCYLHMVNLHSGTVKLTEHQDYDFYERICSSESLRHSMSSKAG